MAAAGNSTGLAVDVPANCPGALAVAAATGADPERVAVFHSLSKRSNLPGLRSGFVAGGPQSIARIRQLRSFAGAPLPLPIQAVSQAAWEDEAHLAEVAVPYALGHLKLWPDRLRLAPARWVDLRAHGARLSPWATIRAVVFSSLALLIVNLFLTMLLNCFFPLGNAL